MTWGLFPRTPVSAAGPDRPPGLRPYFCIRRVAPRLRLGAPSHLLELEGADPVAMRGLVTGVDSVRERLNQAHQGGIRPDVRGPVRAVVEHQLRVLGHV